MAHSPHLFDAGMLAMRCVNNVAAMPVEKYILNGRLQVRASSRCHVLPPCF
jgi:hypothetical protein